MSSMCSRFIAGAFGSDDGEGRFSRVLVVVS